MSFDFDRTPWIDDFLKSFAGCKKDYKEEWQWYRYQVGGKMFAALLCTDNSHGVYANRRLLTLKCEPLETEFLIKEYNGILPGFYMNKQNWISIDLDGNVPEELIKELCEKSYHLVFSKLTKKLRTEIIENS